MKCNITHVSDRSQKAQNSTQLVCSHDINSTASFDTRCCSCKSATTARQWVCQPGSASVRPSNSERTLQHRISSAQKRRTQSLHQLLLLLHASTRQRCTTGRRDNRHRRLAQFLQTRRREKNMKSLPKPQLNLKPNRLYLFLSARVCTVYECHEMSH